ncbi:tetratricopeptide repeat-containing sulfotransferase family protein [Herbaspirillum sp. alder98]|uniref:tetratricopeptide repeat-containing sulfotransferase family protein n=1 Tax=Herbaspirillum sp. alder98 TaxID=2913096 RepID=UPI001CD90C27|nr:tetratricopeptide repeat-containing sulfotransferase family protein [Herbaspirillum sp. alder98]MCA1325170.1 tetratricopeptide repeat protein [Herbaspirillum sp. alder98]
MNNFPFANQITIPEALKRAYAHWNAGQAPMAEQLARQVLQMAPYQPDALHLLGLMAHAYGKPDLALDYLRRACAATTASASYCSNLAEVCRQQGLLTEAEKAARRAVAQDPNLIAGWTNLGIILQESGKLDASLECLQRVCALQPANPEIHNNLGNTYKLLNQLDAAQASYRQALALHPNYPEAHSNLAFLLCDLGRFDEAAVAAEMAIELNPHLADAYLNLAEIEISRLRYVDALRHLNALMAFAPQHPGALAARAQVLIKTERPQDALACARQAVSVAPDNARAHNTLGRALQALDQHEQALNSFDQAAALPGTVTEEAMTARALLLLEMGDKEAAIAAFDRTLAQFPESIRVTMARVDTKTYRADDPDIALMEAALTHAIKPTLNDQMGLHFALGKAYLDSANSERAFYHLDRGNAIKRDVVVYDAEKTGQWMRQIAATFTPELMDKFRRAGAASDRPVFIVGMPRSGTTLVEQILASHADIFGAGELSALRFAVDGVGSFPDDVARWGAEDFARVGRAYLSRVDDLAPHALRLVDKMPANFLYAGLIPLVLSGARIIHCRRDAVDTCLSCYSKHFAGEQLFSYRQDELGVFYRDYQFLMESLREVLPQDRFIEVDYEDVVDDLEAQARRLIAFVGLPWDDACLDFHKTSRVVRTASVSQVRQPIYTTSKGRWRRHAAYLGPLLSALGIDQSSLDKAEPA